MFRGELGITRKVSTSNESLHARTSGGIKRVTQVLRDEVAGPSSLRNLSDSFCSGQRTGFAGGGVPADPGARAGVPFI